jgi:hypothetical protein
MLIDFLVTNHLIYTKMHFNISYILGLSLFCSFLMSEGGNAYEINIYYQKGNNMTSKYTHPFYSYKNRTLEFILEKKTETESAQIHDSITKQTITFDTLSLQLIDPAKNEYVKIDSFKSDFKIVDRGNYKESKIGLKMSLSGSLYDTATTYLRDTLIDEEFYKYSSSIIKDGKGNDSVIVKGFFIPNKNLITFFNLNGLQNNKTSFGFAGYSVFFKQENFTMTVLLQKLRALSKHEEEICESIISGIQ